MDDLIPLIKESLSNGYEVAFSPSGSSMLPLIKEGRDSVTLVAPPKRLKKYDLPLYQRENGQYVLHRVVGVGQDYTCIGDNQFILEKGIKHEQIIAVCVAITKKGKKVSVDSLRLQIYARFWHYTRFIRRVFNALKRRLSALFKKN
jgi:hypothetical protein